MQYLCTHVKPAAAPVKDLAIKALSGVYCFGLLQIAERMGLLSCDGSSAPLVNKDPAVLEHLHVLARHMARVPSPANPV